jgi:hypothetical protein
MRSSFQCVPPRLLAVAAAALTILALAAPAALAQQTGPDAGQNQFFLHGDKATGPFFDATGPTTPAARTQNTERVANPDLPENPIAAFWSQREEDADLLGPEDVNDRDMVLRWFFQLSSAGPTVSEIAASVTVFAVPADPDAEARIIGRRDVTLLVSATPIANESRVQITEDMAEGERLVIQVVPLALEAGLTAVYDSTQFPSGFSFADQVPTGVVAGVDGLASAPANGLAFSATQPADPQRDESEPNIEIDEDGNIYTCGPTGVSQGADYAQVSRDGGNQFYLLGEPPRGQQSFGGGGDCGLATAPERNEEGNFTYAFSGLGPLTNFVTASSEDVGQELRGSPSSQSIPGVDRQWHTFLDADSVLLSYNQQAPRQVVVQRSDDGGVNYGPATPATSRNPDFPGPMHALPAKVNPDGEDAGRLPYFTWSRGRQVFLAISKDEGESWHNCRIAEAPGAPALFPTADNDRAGNIYVAYSENAKFHAFLHVLPADGIDSCFVDGTEVNPVNGAQTTTSKVQADVNPPIQVDRDKVRSSVFGWVAAGGAPGRVAVTFYGSETDGDPNVGPGEDEDGNPTGFRGTWDVYVSQSINALEAEPDVAQVKATTHPFHYDSICLNGTGCSITGGDRSLADFFALDFNPVRHSLHLVYNQGYKRPDDSAGVLATPAVLNQIGGPTLDGEPLDAAQGAPLANRRDDPEGDALADYSRLCLQTDATCPAKPAAGESQPGADLRSVDIGPEIDPATGAVVPNGGFTVKMKVADLSDGALLAALENQRSTSLRFVFRWINGFRSAALVARYNPAQGFRFGFNGFSLGGASCGGTTCLTYPGNVAVPGVVDQAAGTITMSVPRDKLLGLEGPTGPDQRPEEKPAGDETRFYDGTVFVLAQMSGNDTNEQSFLYPYDNTPSLDFLTGGRLPGTEEKRAPAPPPVEPVPPPVVAPQPAPPATSCDPQRVLRSASANGDGRGVRFTFAGVRPLAARRAADRVDVDVFRSSRGRKVVGPLLVARFNDRAESFGWDGRANRPGRRVGNGFYFVRYRVGGDVRRVTLQRRGGRFVRRAQFHRARSCRVLRLFKLSKPVFGGSNRRALGIAYRLTEARSVQVQVLRGRRVVKRFGARSVGAGQLVRLRLSPGRLRPGEYRVRLRVLGERPLTATLVSRRL